MAPHRRQARAQIEPTSTLDPNDSLLYDEHGRPAVVSYSAVLDATRAARRRSVDLEAATRVAICEEGGWGHYGFPAYPDSLGISAANWVAYGGGSDLSPAAQIAVAARIQPYPPDTNGCAAW